MATDSCKRVCRNRVETGPVTRSPTGMVDEQDVSEASVLKAG